MQTGIPFLHHTKSELGVNNCIKIFLAYTQNLFRYNAHLPPMLRMPSVPHGFAPRSRTTLLSPGKGVLETGLQLADANKTQEVPRAFGYVNWKGVISISSKIPHGPEPSTHSSCSRGREG